MALPEPLVNYILVLRLLDYASLIPLYIVLAVRLFT